MCEKELQDLEKSIKTFKKAFNAAISGMQYEIEKLKTECDHYRRQAIYYKSQCNKLPKSAAHIPDELL